MFMHERLVFLFVYAVNEACVAFVRTQTIMGGGAVVAAHRALRLKAPALIMTLLIFRCYCVHVPDVV